MSTSITPSASSSRSPAALTRPPGDDDAFDEFDDASFELAASQLDSLEDLAPPPKPLPAPPRTRRLQEQQIPTRSSPRFIPATRPVLAPVPAYRPLLPALKPAAALLRPPQAGGRTPVKRVVVRGGGAAGAEAKREMEEAAAREVAALCDGAENWSDDDDF